MMWAIAYFLVLLIYAVFSYSLTDPNLIITSWPPYWQFQLWMWQTFFNNRELLTYSYITIIVLLFVGYFGLLKSLRNKNRQLKWWQYGLMISPLLIAYNSLSHDVFNYMFNAKMVLLYEANPHVKVALDFMQDDWLRFMHNTHTPAPYGYGWTALSLIPGFLGMEKFLPTWLLFRVFSVVSVSLLWGVYWLYQKVASERISFLNTALVLFNPLLLIEVIGNQHNDLWMMVPAIASLVLLRAKKLGVGLVVVSALLLGVSVSIKLATILLLPLWLALLVMQLVDFKQLKRLLLHYWPLLASAAMFLPLLTLRSQQFHPWYLVWSLVWLPVFNEKILAKTMVERGLAIFQSTWKISLVILSISSLLRYVPWLWAGGFEGNVVWQQKIVTWVPFFITLLIVGTKKLLQNRPA